MGKYLALSYSQSTLAFVEVLRNTSPVSVSRSSSGVLKKA